MNGALTRFEFNSHGVWAIYKFEISRALRTLVQSLVTPVITTSLYFVVFGAAIGSRMSAVDGVRYGAFIVPGLIMLTLFTESLANASFGIFFPKFIGTIYKLPIGADILCGNRHRLCRRRRVQIGRPRAGYPRHGIAFRPDEDFASGADAVVLGDDRGQFQLVRIYSRAVGEGWEQLQLFPCWSSRR